MLQCNIDAKGKVIRLIYGAVSLLAGIILMLLVPDATHSRPLWIISVACIVGGAFSIFEAQAGWCILRAMGFKTRI
jgi:uncharacterized membrane protein HdeD (DUF308 family)